eukprot:8070454-Ditylum_brightwellii.AAC.1
MAWHHFQRNGGQYRQHLSSLGTTWPVHRITHWHMEQAFSKEPKVTKHYKAKFDREMALTKAAQASTVIQKGSVNNSSCNISPNSHLYHSIVHHGFFQPVFQVQVLSHCTTAALTLTNTETLL